MTDVGDRLAAALRGRYEIERELGEGGMARVFLARDTKHERRVALKVLKPELAAVVGAARFLKEIRTTANLQHPNILPLYDSGEADGLLFYAMPYVEGESLRTRLDRERQLPVADAVRIACEVAEALDYAHRHGVIHRDIKPANLLLIDGRPVVADFGIAIAVSSGGGGRLTETGLSLGTPFYMSPEQATGDQEVGPASDLYSLGCVLYEMLAGDPPFTGSTAQAVLVRVLTGDPVDVTARRRTVPLNVADAVTRAIERAPADRFRDGAELARALRDPSFRLRAGAAGRPDPALAVWKGTAMAALVAAGVMSVAVVRGRLSERALPEAPTRYALDFLEDEGLRPGRENSLALSPDGSMLVYVGPADSGRVALWLKEEGLVRPRMLPGTEGGGTPFFSPDGQRLGYLHVPSRALRVRTLATGQDVELGQGLSLVGAAWSDDGWIYASDVESGALFRYAPESGEREQVTELAGEEWLHTRPVPIPGGEFLVFASWAEGGTDVLAVTRPGSMRHEVIGEYEHALHARSGHLVVARRDGTLLAAPFDGEEGTVDGPFVVLDDAVAINEAINDQGVDFAIAADGTFAYITRFSSGGRRIVWYDRSGGREPIDLTFPHPVETVALAGDGRRAVVSLLRRGRQWANELWSVPLDRPEAARSAVRADELARRPTWFAGGDSMAYVAIRDGNRDAWAKASDGSGQERVLLDLDEDIDEIVVTSQWLIYRTGTVGGDRDIWAVQREPGAEPFAVAADPEFDEYSPVLSPDGRWIAYTTMDVVAGRRVWVRSFPDVDAGVWPVSPEAGETPLWSPHGDELFFMDDTHLVAASVVEEPSFAVGEIRRLFPVADASTRELRTDYAVGPDGMRFLMAASESEFGLVVVENFHAELEARAGR